MTEQTTLNLYQKIASITARIDRVHKDKTNTFHRYDYASKDAIFEALKPLLEAFSLCIVPSVTEVIAVTQPNAKDTLTTVKIDVRVVDPMTGEQLTCHWVGTGTDSGDKGIAKAYANALKTFLINLFQIPCGDDDEPQEVVKPKSKNDSVKQGYITRILELRDELTEKGIQFDNPVLTGMNDNELISYGKRLASLIKTSEG